MVGGIEAKGFTGVSRCRGCIAHPIRGRRLLVTIIRSSVVLEPPLLRGTLLQQPAPLFLFLRVSQNYRILAAAPVRLDEREPLRLSAGAGGDQEESFIICGKTSSPQDPPSSLHKEHRRVA